MIDEDTTTGADDGAGAGAMELIGETGASDESQAAASDAPGGPETPPEPPAPDDTGEGDAAGEGAGDEPAEGAPPEAPTGALRHPTNRKGVYVVLWARVPRRGESSRPAFSEVGFYKTDDAGAAKRAAMRDDANAYLRHSAAQKPGIILRAVPAASWPKAEPTRFEAPEPRLIVR